MKTFGLASLTALTLAFASLATGATGCVATGDESDTDSTTSEIAGASHFEIWKDTAGSFHFHLLAGNKQILVTSQAYSSRTAALGGVLSVLDNGGLAGHYQVQLASNGRPYFNLVAANKDVIATSETYSTRQAAQKGVNATITAIGAYLERWDTATGARFSVFPGKDGRYYFSLYAKNGAVVLQSQAYGTEAAALNGTFSVAENGLTAARYQVLAAGGSGYYVNLVAANGEIIATGQVYASQSDAQRGRDAIIALLPSVQLI